MTPLLSASEFEHGKLTAQEFVVAGDTLCAKNPSWKWQPAGSAAGVRQFLPLDKQFLLLSGAVCNSRAYEMAEECGGGGERKEDDDEGRNWHSVSD